MQMKKCSKCHIEKDIDSFSKKQSWCKNCCNTSAKAYRTSKRKTKPCIYCGAPVKFKVCKSKSCVNKYKRQHYHDNIERYREIKKKERERNFSKRKNKALASAKKRYYSDDLKYVVSRMFQNSRSSSKKYNLEFDLDKEFLFNLFELQSNKCALTGISFKYEFDENLNIIHKRPFAPSLDKINSQKGYTKDNVRIVCIIVNFALCEFGDQSFDEMCEAYINKKRNK